MIGDNSMDANQIVLIMIVVLASIIVIFGIYFLIIYLMNRKREKKVNTIFDPTNLVEEESLMNVMDQKKNIEYKSDVDQERFVQNAQEVQVVTTQGLSQEQKANPFGVDMTIRNKDNSTVELPDTTNNQNKFFK